METRNNDTAKMLEELLLFTGMLVLCCQVFGSASSAKMNVLIGMLWYFVAAGMFVLAGYRCAQYVRGECSKKALLLYALRYYGLFVLAGFGRFVLIDKGQAWDDLMRVAAFISVPKYAEIFFTMVMLFILSAVCGPFLHKLMQNRWLAAVVSLAGLCLMLLPQAAVRYPVFAMWMNSESYRCLPLLSYLGYYFFGMYIARQCKAGSRMVKLCALGSVLYTAIMVFWHRSALVKTMGFPLHYWEVLLPAGLIILYLIVSSHSAAQKMYGLICRKVQRNGSADQIYVKTAVMILLVNVLRGCFEVKRCSALRVFGLFVLLWCLASATALFVDAVRKESVAGFCRKHRKLTYVVLYSVGFVVVFSLVYLPFIENGVSLIWRRDGISQYFPKAMYFSRYVRETIGDLLRGDFSLKMYDFSLGLGDSVPAKLEPLYWLHALFAPENMEAGYEFVMLLRMYLSGLSVSALLLYLKKDSKITWICSYIYCFSGYVLYACTRHAQFMVPFILLPLLVIAVEEILRKKKWYLGCVLIALSMLCSYYFLYMNTIVLALYFFVRYGYMPKENRTWKNFWSYVGCFAGAYILGIGMGSMTIFTSLFNYFGSGRTGGGNMSAESLLYYKKDWLHDVYMSLIAPGEGLGYWMKLGMVPLCLLAVVLLFLRKGKKRELKASMIFCLLGLPFPVFAYFMSGFGSVTNRWLYILALVMTLAVAEALIMIPSLTKKELSILFLATLPYFVLAMYYSRYNTVFYLKGLGMLLITYIVVVFSADVVGILNRRQMLAAMAVLVVAGLAMNGDMLFGANGAALTEEYAAGGQAVQEAEAAKIKACTTIEDDSFYRVTEAETGLYNYCSSAALDVNSVSYFNSTMNGLILDFDQVMGNGRSCVVYHSDFNNRTMLNALASVKYYGALNDETAEYMLPYGYRRFDECTLDGTDYAVYKTDATLPLAYSYDRVMTTEELLSFPVEERQELLMKNAVVDSDISLKGKYEPAVRSVSGYKIEPKEIVLEDVTWEGNEITGEDNGKITFKIDPVSNAEIYFVFKGTTYSPVEGRDITRLGVKSENGKYEYLVREEQNIYYMDFEKYMINFGYSEEAIDSLTLQFYGRGNLTLDEWAIYCQPLENYEEDISVLTADKLENITMENDYIRGTMSTDKDKLLTFSIPYQNGWTAWVDGEKTELVKTNIMYTGLEVAPGTHEIELRYEMPGVKYGIIVTAVSAGVFILIVIGTAVRRKRSIQRR